MSQPQGQIESTPSTFLVVGIGASAGGLEPLEKFFAAVQPDSGMAFVVLQHLSPDFESRMDELLGRQTKLPICKVTNGIEVTPNQVYLIPAKKEMIISAGKLLLTDKEDLRGFSLPIDHFMRSLAHDLGRRAVAIILSGAGSDGSRGIREVHDAGGLVLCQTPDDARFQGMPNSAKQTGVVDAFLEPEAMPEALLRYVRDPARRWEESQDGREPVQGASAIDEILRLLRNEYGIDFAHYKPSTVTRRIERRLTLTNQLDIAAYARDLATNADELNALYRDLLIGVTRFFRDLEAFRRIEVEMIPKILSTVGPTEEIRVWTAGCATGEEAYSLAILFHEQLEAARRPLNVRIFATDVHRHSLDIASAGIYDDESLEDVTPPRRDRYFTREDRRYRVGKELRQLIVFARHNVINDAPFTRLDLISCRNLLIYFQPIVQKKVLSLFHFGLKNAGTMFLGPSETPGEISDEFDTLDSHWRMYRKRRDARLPDIRLPMSVLQPGATPRPILTGGRTVAGPHLLSVYDTLLAKVMPTSVLVDESYQLVHTFGGAEKHLRVRAGRPSTNILDLVGDGLKPALLGALQHAYKERVAVRFSGVPDADKAVSWTLVVDPIRDHAGHGGHYLIRFETHVAPVNESSDLAVDVPGGTRDYMKALENELSFTKESLQTTIEELETSNEELQATNEELVASNEELQSTNEELHSVNEELYTVNVEHQRKITQLAETTDDLDNLLHSIDIGVLFLDEELCVRRYTEQAAHVFRLLPQDIGRRFDSFAPTIQHTALPEEVEEVLKTRQPIERQVTSRDGLIYLLRILPYRGSTGKRGVVVTLIEISDLKRVEARERRLSAIVESSGDAILANDLAGNIIGWNRGAEALFGWTADEATGKPASLLVPGERLDEIDAVMRSIQKGETAEPFESVRKKRDGSTIDVSVTMSPIFDEHENLVGVSSIGRDISQRKRAEQEIQRGLRMRDQFMAMLSHELRNPLAVLLNGCVVLARKDVGAERIERAREAIERQSRHMARLLDDLLDVSRMRQDGIELRRRFIDLRTTVDSAVERVKQLADSGGVSLEVEVPEVAIPVFADADRVQQIEVNVLGNAVKYTPPGGRVRFVLSVEDDQAIVRVRDEGIGIAPYMLERIFEPFVRAVEDTSVHGRSTSGMGLGLALVRAYVNAHGGTVSAHSDGEGKGTVLTVKFPLAQPVDTRSTTAVASTAPGVADAVVLVEDQDDSRLLLHDILQDAGYQVTAVGDGQQAVDVIMSTRPRIALVDIGLPTMSGYDVAKEIRRRIGGSDIFLVALTGYGQQQDRDAVIEAGFDQHLVKPIEVDTLLDVLRSRRRLRSPTS